MTTAVQTAAEKAKFDREVHQFLITSERREQLRDHPATQAIDFNRFAVKWNEDVSETEKNEAAGHLEVSSDASKKINRKSPSDLSNRWTEAKNDINTERTMERNKALLTAMHKNNRIHIASPSTAERAAVGATQSGVRFSLPFVSTDNTTLPRPATSAADCSGHDGLDSMSGDESLIDVGGDDGGQGVESLDDATEKGPGTGAGGTAAGGAGTGTGAGDAALAGATSSVRREDAGGPGKGKAAFVVPSVACSALHSVVPTFGFGRGLPAAQNVWHPIPPVQLPAAPHGQRLWAQPTCGSLEELTQRYWKIWGQNLLGAGQPS